MNEPKIARKRLGNGDPRDRSAGAPGPVSVKPRPDQFAVDYDFLLINHPVDDGLFSEVLGCVTEHRKNSKVVVFAVTYGGSANVAYRIARFLQTMYERVVVCVPSVCKSAGTLIAAGAHCIIFTPFGEIGPLDVQQSRRDEIFGRRSGLTTRSALADLKSHSFDLSSTSCIP
jgi:hypothetical protein